MLEDPSKEVFHQINAEGQLEAINVFTGAVYPIAKALTHAYTLEWGDAICALVREGHTINNISQKLGVSQHTIYKWRTLHPDFNQRLLAARQDRADYFHGQVVSEIDTMDSLGDKEVAAKRLKIDSLKWLAGVDNPEVYGNKTKITGDANAPVTIVLDTGIRRAPPAPKDDIDLDKDQAPLLEQQEMLLHDDSKN